MYAIIFPIIGFFIISTMALIVGSFPKKKHRNYENL